jgi:hypothetical protein
MTDYAKGFKDGFAAGLEEGKKIKDDLHNLPKPLPRLDDYIFGAKEKCTKCGIKISGVMGYVCSSPNCPTFPQVTCGTSSFDITQPMSGVYYRR